MPGASLGNIWTGANVGLTVRLGQDLSVDFGPPHIRPNLSGPGSFDSARPFAWYLFAGAEGRLVARNIFLDGNTVADSHSVTKERLVGDFPVGLAVVIDRVRDRLHPRLPHPRVPGPVPVGPLRRPQRFVEVLTARRAA